MKSPDKFKYYFIIFFIVLFSVETPRIYAFNELEKQYQTNQKELENIIFIIAENSALLSRIDEEIHFLKSKYKNNNDWITDIKLNTLLKKSYSINLEIEKKNNQKELLTFVQNDLQIKIINEIDNQIKKIILNDNYKYKAEAVKKLYDKRIIYLNEKQNFSDLLYEKNNYISGKNKVFNEKNIYVKLGLMHDLIAQIRLALDKLDNEIKFLNKEIDLSSQLIYYFKNNKIENLINEKKIKLNELKIQFDRQFNYFDYEYTQLLNNKEQLMNLARNSKAAE